MLAMFLPEFEIDEKEITRLNQLKPLIYHHIFHSSRSVISVRTQEFNCYYFVCMAREPPELAVHYEKPPCNDTDTFSAPPSTMGPVNHRLRAANFSKIHTGIIRILEPVKPPEAAIAKSSSRKIVAVVSLPITPESIAHPRAVELFRTALRENADSAAGNGKIKLVLLQVAACVGYLHHHFLSVDGTRGKSESGTKSASSSINSVLP